jgi:glycosyltransferase involved in cell wall biosynthesis
VSPIHAVWYDWFIDLRAGGPTGYLANLRYGLDRLEEPTPVRILRRPKRAEDTPPADAPPPGEAELRGLIEWMSRPETHVLDDDRLGRLLARRPRSVHVHTAPHALELGQAFDAHGLRLPLMLTSHCPESMGKEQADIWRLRGADAALCDRLEAAARRVEAMAFARADVWIFPSREAMQPYKATIPEFDRWAEGKDIRFVATGATALRTDLTKEQAKERFGLSGRRVIGYFGRHNEVKGYDLLAEAGTAILDAHEDVAVLVAGKLDGIAPPAHPRWKELGWFNRPAEMLAACDLFVLPNRMTYFDLALVEALSAGAPVLASATGGNISVHAMTDGAIALFEGGSAASLQREALRLLNDPTAAEDLGRRARAAYLQRFTPEAFARCYVALIREIWRDHGIG